jgi:hypothetical protein
MQQPEDLPVHGPTGASFSARKLDVEGLPLGADAGIADETVSFGHILWQTSPLDPTGARKFAETLHFRHPPVWGGEPTFAEATVKGEVAPKTAVSVVPRQPTTGAPKPTITLFADRRRYRLLAKLGPIANDARRILVEIIPFTVIQCGIVVFEAQEVRNGE